MEVFSWLGCSSHWGRRLCPLQPLMSSDQDEEEEDNFDDDNGEDDEMSLFSGDNADDELDEGGEENNCG